MKHKLRTILLGLLVGLASLGVGVGVDVATAPPADAHNYYGPTSCWTIYGGQQVCARDVCTHTWWGQHSCNWNWWYA